MRAYGDSLTAAVWASSNHVIHRLHAVFMSIMPFSYARERKKKGGN